MLRIWLRLTAMTTVTTINYDKTDDIVHNNITFGIQKAAE